VGEFSLFLVVAGSFAVILGGLAWLASRARRRGISGAAIGAAMAAYDEIFHPSAHKSHFEVQVLEERELPMPTPDDH
jgi:hypothetical protein